MPLADLACHFCGQGFLLGEVPAITLNGKPICDNCKEPKQAPLTERITTMLYPNIEDTSLPTHGFDEPESEPLSRDALIARDRFLQNEELKARAKACSHPTDFDAFRKDTQASLFVRSRVAPRPLDELSLAEAIVTSARRLEIDINDGTAKVPNNPRRFDELANLQTLINALSHEIAAYAE